MTAKNELGARMKEYEAVTKTKLMRRQPVIIRLDGKAFHTFTKGLHKPFDDILTMTMEATTKYLCENIQGCVFGYTQSDEISLLLIDYQNINSSAWFDNKLQKIVSTSAGMATLAFNKYLREINEKAILYKENIAIPDSKYDRAIFDSRAFNLPIHEVCNYFIWRQQDAIRNSISSVAQSKFSNSYLHGLKSHEKIELLKRVDNIDFEKDIAIRNQRGASFFKKESKAIPESESTKKIRKYWVGDYVIPIFTEDREYIEQHLKVNWDKKNE